MRMKLLGATAVLLVAVLATPASANQTLNLGFDITGGSPSSPNVTPVTFYNGSNDGVTLLPGNFIPFVLSTTGDSLTLTFNATALLAGLTVNHAELFVDATGIDDSSTAAVFVQGGATAIGTNDVNLGHKIPGHQRHMARDCVQSRQCGFERRRQHVLQPGQLTSSTPTAGKGDTTFQIKFQNTSQSFFGFGGDSFRLDGINLQFDVNNVVVTATPEPSTLLSGALGVVVSRRLVRWKRRRAAV